MNPVKKVREEYHLTMKALASLAGIGEQNVVKAEAGMGSLPPSIVDAISTLTGDSALHILNKYEEWIEAELMEVKLPPSRGSDKMILDRVTFIEWKAWVCELNDMPNTTVGFCKLFKLHPYVIDKWEGGKLKSAPLQLVQHLAFMRGIF